MLRSQKKYQTLDAKDRRYIDPQLEPVLRVDGAVLVGLNTSQGVLRHTLTWNLRDIGVIGHLGKTQLERASREFQASRANDARVIVMHHNPVRGELSQRHGLKNTKKILGAFAEMGVDLSACGLRAVTSFGEPGAADACCMRRKSGSDSPKKVSAPPSVPVTAQPMAAPVMPYLGMSSRSRLTFTTTARTPLTRLQLLRPLVTRIMST